MNPSSPFSMSLFTLKVIVPVCLSSFFFLATN
jgi:hypothetical protein